MPQIRHSTNCRDFCEGVDPLTLLIRGYQVESQKKWEHCISNKHHSDRQDHDVCDYDECVFGCIKLNGKRIRPSHAHQKRVFHVLQMKSALVCDAFRNTDVSKFKDFEELYAAVKSICWGSGFRQLCTYDTALRIAASSNGALPKDYVYLHCGALKGARALWKIVTLLRVYIKRGPLKPLNRKKAVCQDFPEPDDEGNLTVPIDFFCKELQALGASAIEDFLCVCRPLLEGYYLKIAATLC